MDPLGLAGAIATVGVGAMIMLATKLSETLRERRLKRLLDPEHERRFAMEALRRAIALDERSMRPTAAVVPDDVAPVKPEKTTGFDPEAFDPSTYAHGQWMTDDPIGR